MLVVYDDGRGVPLGCVTNPYMKKMTAIFPNFGLRFASPT